MFKILLLLYILFSILLIFLILLNHGKGSELGAINQNNELLSSRDSNIILNRIIIFIAISIVIFGFLINIYSNKNVSLIEKPIINLSK